MKKKPLMSLQAQNPGKGIQPRPKVDLEQFRKELAHLERLPENWDGEGAPPCDKAQTRRVEDWFVKFCDEYFHDFGDFPPAPHAAQADTQSIDLFWEKGSFHLLVNFPQDPDEACTYHAFSTERSDLEWQGESPRPKVSSLIKNIIQDHFHVN